MNSPAEDRGLIIDLGAGNRRAVPEAISVDVSSATKPDVNWNLNSVPYPFDDSSASMVYCRDVLEHVDDLVLVLEEIHRIGRRDCIVEITAPHYSCSNTFRDPTHRRGFSAGSFDYFEPHSPYGYYSHATFRVARRFIHFHNTRGKRFLEKWANSRWDQYEHHWSGRLPAWYVEWTLEVVK